MTLKQSRETGQATIDRARRERYGFLKEAEVAAIASDPATRCYMLLVRCGACRFMAPAQDVRHLVSILEASGRDYVRDVCVPSVSSHAASPAVRERS